MNKHYLILSLFFAIVLDLGAQNFEKLIDSVYINNVHAKFDSFAESVDSLQTRKEYLELFIIYHTHLKDNDIEEGKFSPEYYLSGEFLDDLEKLQILQKNTYKSWNGHYFVPGEIIVYDNKDDIVYHYYSEKNHLERYFYYDEPLYHYIAKLYKNKQIDCAFTYPSVINQPAIWQEHYSQLMYLVFAIKNGDFYVIRDGKAPAMYSLEDYINCCWDEMTGKDK